MVLQEWLKEERLVNVPKIKKIMIFLRQYLQEHGHKSTYIRPNGEPMCGSSPLRIRQVEMSYLLTKGFAKVVSMRVVPRCR